MLKSKILVIAVTLLVFSGCTKKLDVQPQNNVTPDQITTADDVTALVFGAYSTLQNANAFGEMYNTVTELLFDDGDMVWAGTFAQYNDLHEKQTTSSNGLVYQMWANAYQTINGVNLALSKSDLIAEDDRPAIEGECRFLRGIVYFQLINMYAKPYSAGNTASNPGVPLVLEPIEGFDAERDKRPRASVEEVYTQILADLTFAAENLPEVSENYRASKYSAFAFLSRVYLQQSKYAEAAQAANEVIESGVYELTPSFGAAFNNVASSIEDVFAIQQSSQSNSGTSNFGIITFYSSYPTGRGEIQISEDHISKFEPDDSRGQFVYEGESISGTVGFMTEKWAEPYRAIPVVRLAEMYLTRAEGNIRTGTQVGPNTPLEDVNEIRARAGATLLSAVTADDVVDERLRELAFEGDKFLTFKRLKMNVGSIPFDDPILVLPIPEREIDLGSALPQNEGY